MLDSMLCEVPCISGFISTIAIANLLCSFVAKGSATQFGQAELRESRSPEIGLALLN